MHSQLRMSHLGKYGVFHSNNKRAEDAPPEDYGIFHSTEKRGEDEALGNYLVFGINECIPSRLQVSRSQGTKPIETSGLPYL
jgi:hypothetical protein